MTGAQKVSTRIAVLLFTVITAACADQARDSSIDPPAQSANGDGVVLPDGSVFTQGALLQSFGTCISDALVNFEVQSQRFADVANAAVSNPEQRNATRAAWEQTIDAWQELEVMQIGPAGRRTQPGGQGLRDTIYSWPLMNRCAVDSHLVSKAFAQEDNRIKINANGLWAAEYLLFYQGTENACDLEHMINEDGSWTALDADELKTRRAQYAAFAADAVAQGAKALVNAWLPAGEDFLGELTQAGDGSRTFGRKRVALNAVSDALFYVEWATKDNKLARPLGLIGCDQNLCPDMVESVYARRSISHLRNNLVGFRKLFNGCGTEYDGLGFDDFLFALGQVELASEIDNAALATIEALDNIEQTDLMSGLREDPQSVMAIHTALRSLTDVLRTDFLTVLRLELPQMVQGDND